MVRLASLLGATAAAAMAAALPTADAAEQRVYGVVGSEVGVRVDPATGRLDPAANVHVIVTRQATASGTLTTVMPQP